MKILIISDAWHPQVNGVVRTYEYLKEALERQGHSVQIIGPGDIPWTVPMPGYPEIRLALGPYGRLKRVLRDGQADLIHIGTEGPLGMAARRYCLKHDLPFTSFYHTQFPDYVAKRVQAVFPRLARIARKIAWNHIWRFHESARAMICGTDTLEKELRDHGITTPVIPFTRGVDTSLFHRGPKTLFQDLSGPVALYVGRIAIEKSIGDFMDMPWHGSKVVVGDGPMLAELTARYPDIVFTGKKTGKELADHYRSADVFVFPSRTDTFGMVIVEALACGLPVAAYPVTGPIDIITEPYLGVLDDDLSKAAGQALMLINPDLRTAHVKERYSWDTAAKQFVEKI